MDVVTMSWIAQIAGYVIAGFALGLFYFGGLWLTLRRLPDSDRPHWLVLGSFFGRTLVCVAAFYWLAQGSWQWLVVLLAGFVVARMVLTRRLGAEQRSNASTSRSVPLAD